jgi:hypothetical protein
VVVTLEELALVTREPGVARSVRVGRFNLASMRHTGRCHELFTGRTLDVCPAAIRDAPWFQP